MSKLYGFGVKTFGGTANINAKWSTILEINIRQHYKDSLYGC